MTSEERGLQFINNGEVFDLPSVIVVTDPVGLPTGVEVKYFNPEGHGVLEERRQAAKSNRVLPGSS